MQHDATEPTTSITFTQVEIIKKLNTTHHHWATSAGWVLVDGVQHAFNLPAAAEVEIIAHGHGNAYDANRRLDVGIFVDDKKCGLDGSSPAPQWSEPGGIGMALSHTPFWVPMISVANVRLEKGIHVINLRIRNPNTEGRVEFNGAGMTIKIFHERTLTLNGNTVNVKDKPQ